MIGGTRAGAKMSDGRSGRVCNDDGDDVVEMRAGASRSGVGRRVLVDRIDLAFTDVLKWTWELLSGDCSSLRRAW